MGATFSFNRKPLVSTDENELRMQGVYPPEFDEKFKAEVRKRDKNKCAMCGKTKRNNRQNLDVHHINYTKYTVKINCISLCRECHERVHSKAHSFAQKEVWKQQLYREAAKREGVHTMEEYRVAWRIPDEQKR